jgi:hypothetical protein
LIRTGIRRIEVTSFISPKAIPRCVMRKKS